MPSSKAPLLLSKIVLGAILFYAIYFFSKIVDNVNRHQISTKDGIYINSITENRELYKLANTLTQNCTSHNCKVQNILNYVTNIPYKVNQYQAHSPKRTLHNNFGDCDDKSNLLSSLLHEINIKSYFVLVPKHIFTIVQLPKIAHKKALYLNGEPYYILESTAKNSSIGFPLHYRFDEIEMIIDPYENQEVKVETIEYK